MEGVPNASFREKWPALFWPARYGPSIYQAQCASTYRTQCVLPLATLVDAEPPTYRTQCVLPLATLVDAEPPCSLRSQSWSLYASPPPA